MTTTHHTLALPALALLALARRHETVDAACSWVWMLATPVERNAVDTYLVAIQHPSAYEASTAEQRFRAIVRELR